MTHKALALMEVASEALAEMVRVDHVKEVRDLAEQARLYGRQIKDRTIIANATEVFMRAERRLGEILRSAHETGQMGIGRPSRSNVEEGEEVAAVDDAAPAPVRITLKEAEISKHLSSRAQKLAEASEAEFAQALQAAREKILAGGAIVVNPLKDLTTAQKKARRAEREAALGKKQMALPEAKFGVILADPEWRFETFSTETGMDRAADNHYPTSTIDAIKSRDVGSLAADDSVCWLWATVPLLHKGIEVMQSWGFEYKSHLIWNKDGIGTGYWFRNKHELLLVGTRGNIPAPAMGEQFPSVIDAPVGEHSAKPATFYEIIEAYFPTLPKIELNARAARRGWARWGYEAPDEVLAQDSGGEEAGGVGASPLDKSNAALPASEDASANDGMIGIDRSNEVVTAGEMAPLSLEQTDAIIRAGDADKVPLADLAVRIGRPGNINYVKNRRRVLGLSSRDRQREAVADSNRRRAEK